MQQMHEEFAKDYQADILHYIKEKAVISASENIKEGLETVKEGAE